MKAWLYGNMVTLSHFCIVCGNLGFISAEFSLKNKVFTAEKCVTLFWKLSSFVSVNTVASVTFEPVILPNFPSPLSPQNKLGTFLKYIRVESRSPCACWGARPAVTEEDSQLHLGAFPSVHLQ